MGGAQPPAAVGDSVGGTAWDAVARGLRRTPAVGGLLLPAPRHPPSCLNTGLYTAPCTCRWQ